MGENNGFRLSAVSLIQMSVELLVKVVSGNVLFILLKERKIFGKSGKLK